MNPWPLAGLLLVSGALAQPAMSPFSPTVPPASTAPLLTPAPAVAVPVTPDPTLISDMLGAPRIGKHPGLTRFVLDLPDAAQYTLTPTFGGLRVDLTGVTATAQGAQGTTQELLSWQITPVPGGATVILETPFPLGLAAGWTGHDLAPDGTSARRLVIDVGPTISGGATGAQAQAVVPGPSSPGVPVVPALPPEPQPVTNIVLPTGGLLGAPRLGITPGSTRVVLDLPPGARHALYSTPTGVRVSVSGVNLAASGAGNVSPELAEWRYEPAVNGGTVVLRTAYRLSDRGGLRSLVIPPGSQNPNTRLVLDFSPAYADTTPMEPSETVIAPFLSPVRIVLDPGHGGTDPGAVGGVIEKDTVLAVSLRVRDLLAAAGATVVMTRDSDAQLSLEKKSDLSMRAAMGSAPADLLVSVHANAMPKESVLRGYGIETWWYPNDPGSNLLAAHLQNEMIRFTGAYSRGLKSTSLAVLRRSRVPAALVEIGFISHPVDVQNLQSAAYLERVAVGIAWGVRNYVQSTTIGSVPAGADRP